VTDTQKPADTPTGPDDTSRGAVGPSTASSGDATDHNIESDEPPDPSEIEPTDNSTGSAIDLERLEEIEEFGGEG